MSKIPKILIVDDNPEVLGFLCEVVKNQGYEAFEACNAITAIEYMEDNIFHAAIIDVVLPDMNGIELMRKLRRIDPDLSPIIITGCGDIESAVDALNEGAEEYLLKPVNLQELQAVLSKVITRRRTLEQKRHLEEMLHQSEENYRKTVSKLDDAIILTETIRHRIIDANSKTGEITGRRIQDLLKMTIFDLFPGMVHSELREILKKIRRCKHDMFNHLSMKRNDETVLPVEVHAQWVESTSGKLVQFIFHDISKRKEIEDEKWRSQRFLKFREIAGITKDKVNAPLLAILEHTQSLKTRIDIKNIAIRDSIRSIEEQVLKLQCLLDRIHDFLPSEENKPVVQSAKSSELEHKADKIRKNKILIVDDEPGMRQVLEEFFTINRFEVVTSGDGEEGLKKIKQGKIDLVITDLTMPGMDGVDLLKEVKKHSRNIPVILMTGINLNQVDNIARKYGADGYIVKPFSFYQVMKLVNETLSKGPVLTIS